MIYTGIDPGWEGAVVSIENGEILRADSFDKLTPSEIVATVFEHASNSDLVIVERVWGRPIHGVKNAFRFGEAYGLIYGPVYTAQVEYGTVVPLKWMLDLDYEKGEGKAGLVDLAKSIFPGVKFAQSGKHGYTDAALIAFWGSIHYEG